MAGLPAEIEKAAQAGVHAFIIADPGVLRLAQKYAPRIPVHLSTQANTTNAEAAAFWLDQGVERLNLARELNRDEIAAIQSALPHAELEVFVQGAMCLAVSGQCLLSAWLNRRPANAGRCTQPCRFDYRARRAIPPLQENTPSAAQQGCTAASKPNENVAPAGVLPPGAAPSGNAATNCLPVETLIVEEQLRDGEDVWRVQQGEKYSKFWAPDDLCLLPFLPWFAEHGIKAVKVEGRIKSVAYVAHMADIYKSALTSIASGNAFDPAPFMRELMYISSRPLCTGFFLPEKREVWQQPEGVAAHVVVARVLERAAPDEWIIEVRANWAENARAELMLPGLKRPPLERYELINHRGEKAASLPNGIRATLVCDDPEIRPGIFIRAV